MKVAEVQDVFTQSELNTDDSEDPHIVNFIKALGIIYAQKSVGLTVHCILRFKVNIQTILR